MALVLSGCSAEPNPNRPRVLKPDQIQFVQRQEAQARSELEGAGFRIGLVQIAADDRYAWSHWDEDYSLAFLAAHPEVTNCQRFRALQDAYSRTEAYSLILVSDYLLEEDDSGWRRLVTPSPSERSLVHSRLRLYEQTLAQFIESDPRICASGS